MTNIRVISLGWGVQSFTIAAMAALREIPFVDIALHADTLHESSSTYDFAKRWTPWLFSHNVQTRTIKNPTGGIDEVIAKGQVMIPAFTLNQRGKPGQLLRTCTQRWKVQPLRKFVRYWFPKWHIEMLLGISLDEIQRVRTSNVKYITNVYPLIEKRMTRDDCVAWLRNHGLAIPHKSACVFCPYRDTKGWRQLLPDDASEAARVDDLIRYARPGHTTYIHPARIPLYDVDLRTAEEKGQLSLWDEECEGICGV